MKHDFAKKLRRDQTEVERKLWNALRGRQFHGFKFRRQQPVGPYIPDFVCFEARYVIELDGSQHGESESKASDLARTRRLAQDGFRIRRFWNRELIDNFEGVLTQIWRDLGEPTSPVVRPVEKREFRPSRYVRRKP